MTYQEAEASNPGLIAEMRDQFVGNETDTDEYGETQPAKGLGMIAHLAELQPDGFKEEVVPLVVDWLQALGGRYEGAEQLQPILSRYFDACIANEQHPYYETVEETIEAYEDLIA